MGTISTIEGVRKSSSTGTHMREEAFQNKVLALCRWLRLRTYHTYDSRRSDPGFPDLVIVGRGGVIFAELKSTRGKVSLHQQAWWEDLTKAGAEAYIWRPEDWEQIQIVLKRVAGHDRS